MATRRGRQCSRWALAVLLSAWALGCQATFVEPATAPGRVHSRWSHFWLLGSVGSVDIDARDVCASGRARSIRTYANVPTALLTVVTAGIYAPRKVEVTCELK